MSITFYDKVNMLLHKSQKRTLPPDKPSGSLETCLIKGPNELPLKGFPRVPQYPSFPGAAVIH